MDGVRRIVFGKIGDSQHNLEGAEAGPNRSPLDGDRLVEQISRGRIKAAEFSHLFGVHQGVGVGLDNHGIPLATSGCPPVALAISPESPPINSWARTTVTCVKRSRISPWLVNP
jgi:hypothetical protein